ncbi:NADPH-dependent FMN reductase [Stackebrandtia nassauensis]|uniref:NADPH-dependent FMN reductase n=1 Tax=Stackebrandtia nassauensis (strain DSM 44728 / CIP 108903 / NRRL B-16338 / NBRC 102104 / LLR-40K-21) TaxID=446470 RepID=D3PZF9_STANL|nr:NAD(P)H-dependent oxidoreductase [Stackebrandtia nassauensis]ADD41633.1 NADPH-dependent FMN reductase [Stackebrandtia nassauensis DSM 44728]
MTTRIAVITGSTRPGRRGALVADWVVQAAASHPAVAAGEAAVDLIDLADLNLPLLDEAMPPIMGQYEHTHTKEWAATIDSYDGFLFVVPEYNHSFPGALKNALDYLYAEWNNKAAGFVGYGPGGGIRAVEQLRLVLAELKIAAVRDQVVIGKHDHADLFYQGVWTPTDETHAALELVLTETLEWAEALKTVRAKAKTLAAA